MPAFSGMLHEIGQISTFASGFQEKMDVVCH